MKFSSNFSIVLASLVANTACGFTPVQPRVHNAASSTRLYEAPNFLVEDDSYMADQGAFISPTVIQNIPLTADQFWSGFDDYLTLQKSLSGHGDTWLHEGGGKAKNGVGAEIFTEFDGSITREVLWQKDDWNKVWVMGIPEPNHMFKYYRCTVSVWPYGDAARARLAIEGVLQAEDAESRAGATATMEHFIPKRIDEICACVLHRDGLQSEFDVELDIPIDDMWAIVSDWENNVDWVQGATGCEYLGDGYRRISFESGSTLDEVLVSSDDDTHTLTYSVTESSMPVRMYEGTVTLKKDGKKKCILNYKNQYIVNDDIDGEEYKEAIDKSFKGRAKWMKKKW